MRLKISLLFVSILLFVGCKKEDLTSVNDFYYLENNGASMPVFVEGNAASQKFVIVLHGGPGGDAQIYNALIEMSVPLEDKYAMVYWDQRGSGISSGNYSAEDVTVSTFVDDLDKLVEFIKVQYGDSIQIYLMGHSWGGALGTAYLLDSNRQNKIQAWIEIDGAHNFSNCSKQVYETILSTTMEQLSDTSELPGLLEAIKTSLTGVSSWEAIYGKLGSIDTSNFAFEDFSSLNALAYKAMGLLRESGYVVVEADLKKLKKEYAYFSSYNTYNGMVNLSLTNTQIWANELEKVVEWNNAIDFTSQLNQITIPTLFLWGKYDLVLPLTLGEEAYDNIGAATKQMVVFENSDHSPMICEPTDFVNAVISFVDNN